MTDKTRKYLDQRLSELSGYSKSARVWYEHGFKDHADFCADKDSLIKELQEENERLREHIKAMVCALKDSGMPLLAEALEEAL